MFDTIPPARLATLLGGVLRQSARWDRPLDEFQASQVLSAGSIARYLGSELAAGEVLRGFAGEVGDAVGAALRTAEDAAWVGALGRALSAHGAATTAPELGAIVRDLLVGARGTTDPTAEPCRRSLCRSLAVLVDGHVAALADAHHRQEVLS